MHHVLALDAQVMCRLSESVKIYEVNPIEKHLCLSLYLIVAFPSPIILVKRFPTLSLIRYFTPALLDRLESIKNTYPDN